MKKLIFLLLFILVAYSIYFDVTKGTLPQTDTPVMVNQKEESFPYKEIQIEAGDTLLSIMEREDGRLLKPIPTIMEDFKKLNDGASPHTLKIGKTYKFPIYSNEQ
ncbi:MAG: hypothetical protein ACI35P_01780 [Bacillus sp. (in: firmicutes)]